METAFAIIAEPNRRAILSLLVASQRSVGEIERHLRMSQPTVSKHLRVLRDAGFVEYTVDAQRRLYRLNPKPLREVDAWLAPFRELWSARVDALERYLDRMDDAPAPKRKRRWSDRDSYVPGPANVARVRVDGETKVWRALTEPRHLREWAPFDAAGDLGSVGMTDVTWVGAPAAVETRVTRADAPEVLEYASGDTAMRWELEARGDGTRLTLWAVIDRRYIAMGAAGWHVALDVLERLLDGTPLGRIAGATALRRFVTVPPTE